MSAAQLKEVELEQQALTWPEKAKAIAIRNQQTYDEAASLLVSIATLEKEIIEHHKEPKQKAFESHRAICAAEKRLLDPLQDAKAIVKRAIGAFEQEQERIRLEVQRRAEEEARRKEEEARLTLAIEAEKHGATEETKAEILTTPLPIQAPMVAPTFQRAAGISAGRKPVYRWRVVNPDLISRTYLKIDEVKVNGIVRAMGAATRIPGIEVYEDVPNISVRSNRR